MPLVLGGMRPLMRFAVGIAAAHLAYKITRFLLAKRRRTPAEITAIPPLTSADVPEGVLVRLEQIAPRMQPPPEHHATSSEQCHRGQWQQWWCPRLFASVSPEQKAPERSNQRSVLQDNCSFCLEALISDVQGDLRITPCNHGFHAHCLEQWIFHCTKAYLDPDSYILTRTGLVQGMTRLPTCPNCGSILDVVPEKDFRSTLVKMIMDTLSITEPWMAILMVDFGIVHHPRIRVDATRRRHGDNFRHMFNLDLAAMSEYPQRSSSRIIPGFHNSDTASSFSPSVESISRIF